MKQTAVEWLRKELLKRDMDTSIRELFEQAKEMEKKEKIIQQLFIGKVSEIIGFSETIELLKESKETFNL